MSLCVYLSVCLSVIQPENTHLEQTLEPKIEEWKRNDHKSKNDNGYTLLDWIHQHCSSNNNKKDFQCILKAQWYITLVGRWNWFIGRVRPVSFLTNPIQSNIRNIWHLSSNPQSLVPLSLSLYPTEKSFYNLNNFSKTWTVIYTNIPWMVI